MQFPTVNGKSSFPLHACTVLVLLWAALILVKYFETLVTLPWLHLVLSGPNRNTPDLLLPLSLFFLFNLIAAVIGKFNRKAGGHFIFIGLVIATVALFLAAADSLLWLKAPLFFGVLQLAALGAVLLYRTIFKSRLPYWAGLLLSIIFIQYWLFVAGLSGVFKLHMILLFIIPLAVVGCVEFQKTGRDSMSIIWAWLGSLSWPSLYFIEGLWLVLAAGFIGANTPETVSDAMRCHVPYMINLVRDGVLRPNYYWYSHLVASPIQLAGGGGYLFLGELGSKWVTWTLGLCAVLVMIAEAHQLVRKWSIALGTGFFFVSTPFIWLWLTTNYCDLPMTAYCLAGLACFRRAVGGQMERLPLSGVFFGFACVAKLNALIFVVSVLTVYLAFQFHAIILALRKARPMVLAGILGFLLVVLPWQILVWHWTDNPVFPLMNGYFKSPYISSAILDSFSRNYRLLFKFPNGWWDLLTWPWSMTFQTGSFAETVAGAMGPLFLIAYPVSVLVLVLGKSFDKKKVAMTMFLAGLLYIAACSILLQAPYLRYWLPGLLLLFLAMGISCGSLLDRAGSYYPKWINAVAMLSLVTLSLLILFAWGVRLNYAAPDGLGWTLYRGKISRDEYLMPGSGNVYGYVNKNISPGESVMAVDYPLLNTINNFSFQIMPWYDPVIGLRTLEDYDALVKKANVRYWIVRHEKWQDYYEALGVMRKYWLNKLCVYRANDFSVYTTKLNEEPSAASKKRLKRKNRSLE